MIFFCFFIQITLFNLTGNSQVFLLTDDPFSSSSFHHQSSFIVSWEEHYYCINVHQIFMAIYQRVVEWYTHIYRCLPQASRHQSSWGLLKVTLKPQPAQMLSWQLHFFPPSEYFVVSSKSVQRTSASRSSWVWSALLKVTLTVWDKAGDSTSPSFSALWFSSL